MNQVELAKKLLESKGYEIYESSNSNLESDIRNCVKEVLTSPEFGFSEDEAEEYSFVEIREEDDHTVVEVRAEVSYDGLIELAEKLDDIVVKYDKDAYFDAVTSGIIEAHIYGDINESKRLKESNDSGTFQVEILKDLMYSYLDDDEWTEDEWRDLGFEVKGNEVYLPAGTYEAKSPAKGEPNTEFYFKIGGEWLPYIDWDWGEGKNYQLFRNSDDSSTSNSKKSNNPNRTRVDVYAASEHNRGYGMPNEFYGYETIDHPELGEFMISVGTGGDVRTDGRPWDFFKKEPKLTREQIQFIRDHQKELGDLMISGNTRTYIPLIEYGKSYDGWDFNKAGKHEPYHYYSKDYKGVDLLIYPPQKMSNFRGSDDWIEGYEVYLVSDRFPNIDSFYEESKKFDTFEEAAKYLEGIVDTYIQDTMQESRRVRGKRLTEVHNWQIKVFDGRETEFYGAETEEEINKKYDELMKDKGENEEISKPYRIKH